MMKKRLFLVFLVSLLLSVTFGITALAAEEITGNENSGEVVVEEVAGPAQLDVVQELQTEQVEEVTEVVTENAPQEPVAEEPETIVIEEITAEETNVIGESEAVVPVEAAVEEATVEDDKTLDIAIEIVTEEVANTEATAQPAEAPEAETPQESYSLTFSNGTTSFDTTGGTQVAIKDILAGLGYDVENAIVTVNPDSVDTTVIQIADTEDGPVLSDFGPFAQADRNLVVYINGEAVEISVVDPKEISGSMSGDTFIGSFNSEPSETQDGNVRLSDDVTITGGSLTLNGGVHDLYLNGKTLNLNGNTFKIGSGTTLNIYGGKDKTSPDNGSIVSTSDEWLVETLVNEGNVNIYGGTISAESSGEAAIAIDSSGNLTIYNGTISACAGTNVYVISNNGITTIYNGNVSAGSDVGNKYALYNYAKTNVMGGTYTGIIGNPSGTTSIVGGTFSSGKPTVLSGCTVTTLAPYVVDPGTNVAVRIASDGTMTGHTKLDDAVSETGTVVMLKDITEYIAEYITIKADKSITLNLNGKVLDGNGNVRVITIEKPTDGNQTILTIIDTNPTAAHTGSYEKLTGGVITGGIGSDGYGVFNEGTLNIYAGTITGNNVGVHDNGKVTVGGIVKINGNLKDSSKDNLSLVSEKTISISRDVPLASGASIGITLSAGNGPITSGGSQNDAQYFTSDNANYAVAYVTDHLALVSLDISKATIVASITGATYSAQEITPDVTVTLDGITLKKDTDYTVGYSNNTNAGTATITVTGVGGEGKYKNSKQITFVISPAPLTVSGTTVADKEYDGNTTAQVTCGTVTGYQGSDSSATVSVSANGTFKDKNAGEYKEVDIVYTLSGSAKDNYELVSETGTASITPMQLTVTGTTVEGKVYDGNGVVKVTVLGTLGGMLGGDTVELDGDAVIASAADKNIGEDKAVTVKYSLKGTDCGNYTVADTTNLKATITPKQLAVTGSTAEDKTEDGTTGATIRVGTLIGAAIGDSVNLLATGTFEDGKIGENKAVTVIYALSGADAGNYLAPVTETLQASIKKHSSGGGSSWTSAPTSQGSATSPISNGTWSNAGGSFQYKVNGESLKNSTAWISYTGADGKQYTGCFYFGKDGNMATGWQQIDGVWRYFSTVPGSTYGMMLMNTTTPDGYHVDADGKFVKAQ